MTFKITRRTMMNTIRQLFRLPVSALATSLRRIGWINLYQFPTGTFSLVGKVLAKLIPSRISDAPIYASEISFLHFVNVQIFNTDDTKPVNEFPRNFMTKVISLICDLFMDMRNNFPCFSSFRGFLGRFTEFSLSLGKPFLTVFEKPWIFYPLSIRKGCKSFKTDINTNRFIRFFKMFGNYFTGKANEPFVISSSDVTGFDSAMNIPVKFNSDMSYLGKKNFVIHKFKSRLRICKRVIPPHSFKSWISRLISCLDSTEKGFKCKIDTNSNVLQNLGMNSSKRWSFFFEFWNSSCLIIASKKFFFFLPCSISGFQKLVIKPAALRKSIIENCSLFSSWIYSIFKCFSHVLCNSTELLKSQEQNSSTC